MLQSKNPSLVVGDIKLPLEAIELSLELDEAAKQWRGKWKFAGLNYPLAGINIMPLGGEGDVTLTHDKVQVVGTLSGAGGSATTNLALNYDLAKPESSSFALAEASLPYLSGIIALPTLNLNLHAPMTLHADAILAGITPNPDKPQEALDGKLGIHLRQLADAKGWSGEWHAKDIAYSTDKLPLPPLSGKGTLRYNSSAVDVSGALASAKRTHRAAFDMHYGLAGADAVLRLKEASMPWGGGSVAVRNARVPLGKKAAITLNLDVRKVAIDTLLQSLTGNKATATGVVSGSFPLTITAAGDVRVGKGTLKAEQPGVIALSPEVIPGDNAQVAIARDVLKNLHYTLLSLELGMEEDGGVNVRLAVDGSNPEVENGRPIKLKVNLSGDVLDLIKQNITLMSDPETFIEQNDHEKN
jgi:hypothetical protein